MREAKFQPLTRVEVIGLKENEKTIDSMYGNGASGKILSKHMGVFLDEGKLKEAFIYFVDFDKGDYETQNGKSSWFVLEKHLKEK